MFNIFLAQKAPSLLSFFYFEIDVFQAQDPDVENADDEW